MSYVSEKKTPFDYVLPWETLNAVSGAQWKEKLARNMKETYGIEVTFNLRRGNATGSSLPAFLDTYGDVLGAVTAVATHKYFILWEILKPARVQVEDVYNGYVVRCDITKIGWAKPKIVYFVRHCRTKNNDETETARRAFKKLHVLGALWTLFRTLANPTYCTDLAPIYRARQAIEEDGHQVTAYWSSPLRRAVVTAGALQSDLRISRREFSKV